MLLMMAEKYENISLRQDNNERKSNQLARSHIPLTMTLSFGFGLVLGWMLFGTPAFANYYSTRGSSESTFGWGESVTVDGRSVPVKEYISNSISPENIKENLRLVCLGHRHQICNQVDLVDYSSQLYQNFTFD